MRGAINAVSGWIMSIVMAIYRLLIEDVVFAGALMLWLAFTCADLPVLGAPPELQAVLLPGGIAFILLVNVPLRVRRRRRDEAFERRRRERS